MPRGLSFALGAALMLSCFAQAVAAASSSGQFTVTATLQAGNGAHTLPAGYCFRTPDKLNFGAVVTVVCGSRAVAAIDLPSSAAVWTPIHGGAYRYTHVAENELPIGRLLGGFDSYTGWGTVTSWRMVSWADLDYLEVQIGW